MTPEIMIYHFSDYDITKKKFTNGPHVSILRHSIIIYNLGVETIRMDVGMWKLFFFTSGDTNSGVPQITFICRM